jgi:UDP-N-acetylglucosamine 2-epimerase (hydrolysing)
VTSELDQTRAQARALVEGVLGAGYPCLAVYPNNDEGSEDIFREYALLESVPHICMFPSIRFEYFLTFLRGADFIVGNSSAGIREAPVYGVPTIDVGSRQRGRFRHATITGVEPDSQSISDAIQAASRRTERVPSHHFGDGRSAEHFIEALESDRLWKTTTQKQLLEFLNDE